jgi:hypothetical protein
MGSLRSLLLWISAASVMTACASVPPPPPAEDPDLKQIQGTWRLDMGRKGHVLKQIVGTQEVVSHYDGKGNLAAQHTATIGVRRIYQEPPVRVFYFQDLVVSMGDLPVWPHDQTRGEYIYSCDGNRFVEYQWSVGDLHLNAKPRVVVWKRDDYAAAPAYVPPTTTAPATSTYPSTPPNILYQ